MLCSCFIQAQTVLINGKVISAATQIPLPNTNISTAKGMATIAALDGSFTLSITMPDTLIISKVGFQTFSLPITLAYKNTPLTITLTPIETNLEEVIVYNGYQALPKERSTGSFSQVTNATLSKQVSTDVLSRLEAVTSGLTFDRRKAQGKTSIFIRGISTIQGPKEPLIILDNFPYSGDLANINPNDIETITVLKDAAATSVWGARAGNGVIVITSKKGRYNKKLSISLSSSISSSPSPNLFYLPQMSSADFIEVEKYLFAHGYNFSDTAASDRPVFSPVYELLFRQRNGSISAAATSLALDSLSQIDSRNEFKRYMYRRALNSQNAVSIQGGSEKIAWRFSAGFDNNIGNLHETYQRITINSSNEFKITDKLKFTTALIYTKSNNTSGRAGFNTITSSRGNLPPNTKLADAQGKALPVMNTYRQPYLDTAGGGKLLDWNYYPLTESENSSSKTNLQNFTASFSLSQDFLKNFNVNLQYQYQNQDVQTNGLYSQNSFLARSFINTFSQINRQTGQVKYIIPKGGILDQDVSKLQVQNLRTQLSYTKKFNKQEINAIAGWEFRDAATQTQAGRTFGYNNEVLTFANIDWANQYPTFVTGSLNFIQSRTNFNRLNNRFLSAYSNLGYTWLSRYQFTASLRRDASNLFGANTNQKWNLLWSLGAAWDISKEKKYNLPALPYLRLRATYGKSGNIDPSIATVSTIAYFITSPYTGLANAIFDKYKNPDLSWEQVATLNIGLDFKFKDDRISGSIDWYHKKGKNLYGVTPIDYTAAPINLLVKNVASIKGSGMDLDIYSINTIKKWKWSTQLQLSTNTDKVTRYYLTDRQGSNFLNGGNYISAIEGKPVYAVFSYRWAGLDHNTGNPLGYLNGNTSADYTALTGSATTIDSLIYHGRALPALFGSLGNTLRYKGFYITTRLSYKFGYYFQKSALNYSDLFSRNITHAEYAQRWLKPGDEMITNVPSMQFPAVNRRDAFYTNAPIHILKGDHIRFQYLTFGYEFTGSVLKKLPFRSLNIFGNIQNLGILWRANKYALDPDYLNNVIPPATSFSAGFNITFK